MKVQLNQRIVEVEPRRIMDVAELKRRMADGALLYWTMVHPKHAVLYDPSTDKVAQLAFFSPLWGLQRGNQIRHDRYDGIYQVFVPTTPAREKHRHADKRVNDEKEMFSQSAAPKASTHVVADVNSIQFEPSI